MSTKQLSFKEPLKLSIIEGSTTPNPGTIGTPAWSVTGGYPIHWNGSKWIRSFISWSRIVLEGVIQTETTVAGGTVYTYLFGGINYYRFVPNTYSEYQDAIYSNIGLTTLVSARSVA